MSGCSLLVIIYILVLLFSDAGYCVVVRPGNQTAFVGENVTFRWNTNNSKPILDAFWGINKGDLVDPGFISVDANGGVTFSQDLDNKPEAFSYKGRVSFVGNLSQGHAWFKLSNVNISDSKQYLVRSVEKDFGSNQYTPADLMVKPKPDTTASPPSSRISTATYIHDLQDKNVVVGQNVTFNFTTVNNTKISSLNFGIYSGGEVSKVYKTRSSTRAPQDGNDLPSNLVPRLSFVGNLTRGEAWYKIVNARKNDSGTYGVKLILPVGAQLYSRAKVNFEVLDDTGPTRFSTTAPNRQTTATIATRTPAAITKSPTTMKAAGVTTPAGGLAFALSFLMPVMMMWF